MLDYHNVRLKEKQRLTLVICNKTYEKVKKSSKENRNKYKLRSSTKKLLKQAEKGPEKILQKVEKLEEKVKESQKDLISINDPDARFMLNKKR